MAGFFEALDRKHVGCGQAAAEGNDLRTLRDLQQFADGGARDAQGALGVTGFPERGHYVGSMRSAGILPAGAWASRPRRWRRDAATTAAGTAALPSFVSLSSS